jgi:hypothetical protein
VEVLIDDLQMKFQEFNTFSLFMGCALEKVGYCGGEEAVEELLVWDTNCWGEGFQVLE